MDLPSQIKNAINPHGCIVVVFGDRPVVGFLGHCPEADISLGQTLFHPYSIQNFLGFFDWMRNLNGDICAIRLWPTDEFTFVSDALDSLPYVTIGGQYATIWIGPTASADEQSSVQQAFGNAVVLLADDGVMAITFGLHFLSEDDIKGLVGTGVQVMSLVAQ